MSATEAPERIGPYRLLRRLGEGGMGVVHLGLDGEGREVAVKVLHPHVASDLKARDRLTREVETMRRVRSHRVAEILDADLTGTTPYIVTRYARGRTLEQSVLEDGPLPDREVVRLARGLCEALVSIHAADVVHRDLKPANVMLVDGEPLVIDFGIAHLVNATRLTQTGMFVGTPGYLAPEIIRDSAITQAADVHALAATVFFAVTGKPPFGSGTFESVCYNILEGKAQVDLAPVWMRAWLRQALDTDASARPTAGSLLRLARALDPTVTALQEMPRDSGGTRVLDGAAAQRLDGTMVLNDRVDGTRVLNDGVDGTRVLNDGVDGTRVLDDATLDAAGLNAAGLNAGGRDASSGRPDRTLPGGDDFADLLPPVNYVRAERPRRESRKAAAATPPVSSPASPPASPSVTPAATPTPTRAAPMPRDAPGMPQAPPYPQPAAYPPPPFPDQRVAGYPAPQAAPPRGYAPPPAQARPYAPDQAGPAARPGAEQRARYRTGHPFLSTLLLTILVALACLLPVTVSLFAIVAVLCLRVGNYLLGDLAERRSVRGSSSADPFLAVLGTPWALIKATMATIIQVPLAAMFAVCVWGGLVYVGKLPTDPAAAYAAGAFVAGLFLLPGGGGPRKAVARTLTAVIRSPGAGMIAAIVVGTIAFFVIMTAISSGASWAPWRPPSVAIDAVVADLKKRGEDTVVNLIGGLIGDIMDRLGLSFLTFWN